MKNIFIFFAVSFFITTYCFSGAVDDIQEENTARSGLYNAAFSSTDADPLGLEQLSEKTIKINHSLTKNVDKNRSATKQEKKVMLQAVFSTEIIYGESRPSYLAGISEDNVIYGHYYVLEYSALLARDFLKFGSNTSYADAPAYQKLYSYCGLDKAQLFDWFSEMFDQHRPGRELRSKDVTIQAQSSANYSDSSLSIPQNSQTSSTYTVISAENCVDYDSWVLCFNRFSEVISTMFDNRSFNFNIIDHMTQSFSDDRIFKILMGCSTNFSIIRGSRFVYISPKKSFTLFVGIKNRQILKGYARGSGNGVLFKTFGEHSELSIKNLAPESCFEDMFILNQNVTLFGTDTPRQFQDKLKLAFGESVMVLA